MPIGYGVRYRSAADGCTQDVRNISNGSDLNMSQWSVPVYQSSTRDRLITIWDNNVGRGFAAHLNPGAQPAQPPGGDSHIAIVNGGRKVVDELWHASIDDAHARVTGDDYARYRLLGPGVGKPRQGDNQGVRAYGGSLIGGLIRVGELKNGIHHALAFSEPRNMQRPGWVWPAISQDTPPSGYTGHVPMGQLVFIPRSNFQGLGLSPYGILMARALHYYGAYNVDSSDGWAFFADPAVGKQIGQAGHDTIAYSDIPILRKLLVCVTNNGPRSVGGGGGYPPQLTPPPFAASLVSGAAVHRPAAASPVPVS